MAEAKKKVVSKSKGAVTKPAKKPTTKAKTVVKEAKATKPASTVEKQTVILASAEVVDEPVKATAKAGKRSEKAIKEVEEKLAKEERKAKAKEDESHMAVKPKVTQKPTRPIIERRGKNYQNAAKLIEKDKSYPIAAAIELAIKTSTVKFDATVELHVNLGVDPRQADQNIRQSVVLPAGSGKTNRVAVFADVDDVAKAKKAGADVAGSDEFLQQLDKGVIDFDILIATPAQMSKLGKYARLLGPKGLMPNPKSGTVTTNVEKAVTEAKSGRIEYRVDSTGIVHVGIGKVSFGKDNLLSNAQTIISSIKAAKPSGLKGNYFKSTYISTSMGPSILVDLS
jgi:large subunit ribosomal protein L1